jgi:hypothetical protein
MTDKEQKGTTRAGDGAEKPKSYFNAAPVPIDLSDGRMLQPNEEVTDIPMNRHNKFLVDVGSLVESPSAAAGPAIDQKNQPTEDKP